MDNPTMELTKEITKTDNSQDNSMTLADLSSKQKDFIEKLLSTGKTFDSYQRAGYEGSYKAAYELRRRLMPWITELSGCTPADVFRSLRELEDMPITDKEVTYKDKLETLKLKAKLARMTKDEDTKTTRHYSQLIIQRFDGVPPRNDLKSGNGVNAAKAVKDVIDVPNSK